MMTLLNTPVLGLVVAALSGLGRLRAGRRPFRHESDRGCSPSPADHHGGDHAGSADREPGRRRQARPPGRERLPAPHRRAAPKPA